jgi:multidrug resistance efflux pump
MSEACETPLVELLDSVPEDARHTYEHEPGYSQHTPYGLYCRRAATALRELAAERDALRAHLESLQNRYAKAAAEVERLREALEPYATWGQEGEFARAALQEQER